MLSLLTHQHVFLFCFESLDNALPLFPQSSDYSAIVSFILDKLCLFPEKSSPTMRTSSTEAVQVARCDQTPNCNTVLVYSPICLYFSDMKWLFLFSELQDPVKAEGIVPGRLLNILSWKIGLSDITIKHPKSNLYFSL